MPDCTCLLSRLRFPGHGGGGSANCWRLLPYCMGAFGNGLSDPWSILWERHLPLSSLYETSEHLGNAACTEQSTEEHQKHWEGHGTGMSPGSMLRGTWNVLMKLLLIVLDFWTTKRLCSTVIHAHTKTIYLYIILWKTDYFHWNPA